MPADETRRVPTQTQSPDYLVHRELWEDVVERLSAEIVSGALPQGTRLVEVELATRFGVSRGPVREALRELARLGLAVDLPRRGSYVSSPTESELEEVYVARGVLETAAARIAISTARDDEMKALQRRLGPVEAAYESGDIVLAWQLDIDFHRAMIQMARNRYLLGAFDTLASQTVMLQRRAEDPAIFLAPPPDLHREIVDAMLARDEARVEQAVLAHYRFTQDRLFDESSRNGH
jgi:DNA-binding GntR family transcriptional regulator